MFATLTENKDPYDSAMFVFRFGTLSATGHTYEQALNMLEDGLKRLCFEAEIEPLFSLVPHSHGAEVVFQDRVKVNFLLLGIN